MVIRAAKIPTQHHIKAMHLQEIYLRVLQSDGISRARLKEEMRLSFPSVSALVDELISNGVLYEVGAQESTQRGRPSILLRVNPDALAIPVINMTRDGYQYSLFDGCAQLLEEGVLPYTRKPVENGSERWCPDADTICGPLEKLIGGFAQKYAILDLVLSVPGSINARGVLTSSALQITMPGNFLQHVEDALKLPICMINNSDAEAYAEKLFQPLPEDFIFLHVGKGVGAGIIRKGKIFNNGPMRAGEIGHISIDYNGKPCPCGNRGCLERYIDVTQICQEAAQLLKQETVDFDQVCQAYRQGVPEIVVLIGEKARLIGVGMSNMLAMQPVRHVVLGGGIEQLGDSFLETLREAIRGQGFRKYMNRLTITYTANSSGNGAQGALWNYLHHQMKIENLIKKMEE